MNIVRPTIKGKLSLSSQNWVFRPNIRVSLGATAKNTGRLLRMLPGVFREISGTVSPFLETPSLIFGAANQFSPEGLLIRLLVKTGARNNGSFEDFFL